jgi:anti-sigma-K factor RskA
MTDLPNNEADKALAGELVLGLLEPAEAAAAQARIATDPSFAAEVSAWSERMVPLILGEAVPPPPAVWSKIESSLRPETGQDNRPSGGGFWKGLSLVSTAAALVMGFMLVNQVNDPPVSVAAPKPLIAALGSETGNASMTAAYDTATGTLTITPVALDTGRLYPELWVIPVGGSATSLGIVDAKRPTQHSLPAPLRALMAKGATLAITPEPAGGAPGGKATGPVLASGAITSI